MHDATPPATVPTSGGEDSTPRASEAREWPPTGSARPYTRWWWLNGPFREEDIAPQLRWLSEHGFGGVEIAWLSPLWRGECVSDRPEWLGPEWSRLITRAKREADALGMGCDFTFGSVWPFGGTCIPESLSSRTLDGSSTGSIRASWDGPESGRVLDHLDATALDHYVGPDRVQFDSLPAWKSADTEPGQLRQSSEHR